MAGEIMTGFCKSSSLLRRIQSWWLCLQLVSYHSRGTGGYRNLGDPGASDAAPVILANLVCSDDLKDTIVRVLPRKWWSLHLQTFNEGGMERMLNLFFMDKFSLCNYFFSFN